MNRQSRSMAAAGFVLLVFFMVFAIRGLTATNNDFHFALIGDRTGGAQPQIFGRVWYEVDLMHPDFVVNVGDTIEGNNDANAEQQWAELRPTWERYKHYPLYFTPGNHDVWSAKSKELYERESKRGTYYSFDYQNTHFTILDTGRGADLSEQQLDYLEEDLKKNAAKSPKIVVFHKPFWIGAIQKGDDFRLHRIAKQYGVDHVISGHGHTFVRRVHQGVTYMEVGSSGGNMTGGLKRGGGFVDGLFYHFMWAHVKDGQVFFTVKEISGPMGQGRMFRADDWDEKGPKFDASDPALKAKPQT